MARRRKLMRVPTPAPALGSETLDEPRQRSWPAIVSISVLTSVVAMALTLLFPDIPLSIPALAGLMLTSSLAWAIGSKLRRFVRARRSTRYGR